MITGGYWYESWLEILYGLRLPAPTRAHGDELAAWVRSLEIRASGSRRGAVKDGQ